MVVASWLHSSLDTLRFEVSNQPSQALVMFVTLMWLCEDAWPGQPHQRNRYKGLYRLPETARVFRIQQKFKRLRNFLRLGIENYAIPCYNFPVVLAHLLRKLYRGCLEKYLPPFCHCFASVFPHRGGIAIARIKPFDFYSDNASRSYGS